MTTVENEKTAPVPTVAAVGGQSTVSATENIIPQNIGELKLEDEIRSQRPGVMIYHEILVPMQHLEDDQKGKLFNAILEFSARGTEPEFESSELAIAWGFIRPKLEHDFNKYVKKVESNRRAAKKRWDRIPKSTTAEPNANASTGMHSVTTTAEPTAVPTAVPTTVPTPTPVSQSPSLPLASAVAVAETAPTPSTRVEVIGGSLGKGVVKLSEDQMSELLDTMGLDTFNYYVDKLSSFIIEKDARYIKNHYELILKWWKEDSALPVG